MKTEYGVYTVQFPASHVTGHQDFTGQKDVKHADVTMSVYVLCVKGIVYQWVAANLC